ncbi:MAG: PA2169 family four-helix-bundle protein [Pseudomonadota bacterium]|nr:PA2169 family four-helix-bundle protein [Pseudomonadota bacterium]
MNITAILNKLIETSKDGEFGFQSCAEQVKSSELRLLFSNRASDCRRAAAQLQDLVRELGDVAEDGGTAGGAAHRGWVAIKAKLASYTDEAVLEECERGEEVAIKRYRDALDDTDLSGRARALVEAQFDGVKRNHAEVRTLRDQARRASAG